MCFLVVVRSRVILRRHKLKTWRKKSSHVKARFGRKIRPFLVLGYCSSIHRNTRKRLNILIKQCLPLSESLTFLFDEVSSLKTLSLVFGILTVHHVIMHLFYFFICIIEHHLRSTKRLVSSRHPGYEV